MRLLAITRGCWDNNNNVGNTLTNLFRNFKNLKSYNLYLRNDTPRDSICDDFFQITESQLIKSVFSGTSCGQTVSIDNKSKTTSAEVNEAKINSLVHSLPFYFPWFVRELIWSFGKWKNEQLDAFLIEANPDVIFMPVFPCWYTAKILCYVHMICPTAKIILYHADDDYSLKQFNLSPLFWLYRFNQRKWIRKITDISSLNYCISEQQVEEYSKDLHCECKLLQKGINTQDIPAIYTEVEDNVVDFVYTGNLICGRWKTLSAIGDAIRKVNEGKVIARLNIYSASVLSNKMRKNLKFDESVIWRGRIPSSEIKKIQDSADVLVHVEALSNTESSEVRLSFSTKIVDYLMRRKFILAVGNKNVASLQYFKKYGNGVVASNSQEINSSVDQIVHDSKFRETMANKAVESARILHDEKNAQVDFIHCIESLNT